MGHQPFSVAISVYKNDNSKFFDRALESITDSQTVKPDEIVLVVDGPVSEQINEVISKYSAKYNFNVIHFETNCGLGNALRIAVEKAKYDLIARMDSDDVAFNTRFEQQLRFFEANPSVDIIGGDISEFIGKEDNIVSFRTLPTSNDKIKRLAKRKCPFNHMTVMFRKAAVIKSGNYLDWHFNEDYFLWVRMIENNCFFANTGTVLVNVRTGKGQFARRGGLKYFKSEKKLQKYMLQHHIISFPRYCINIIGCFFVQCMLPNSLRSFFYKHFLRKKNV